MGQKRCCICKEEMLGWGNNAMPVMDGDCCDQCNDLYVVPYRLFESYGRQDGVELMKRILKSEHNITVN